MFVSIILAIIITGIGWAVATPFVGMVVAFIGGSYGQASSKSDRILIPIICWGLLLLTYVVYPILIFLLIL